MNYALCTMNYELLHVFPAVFDINPLLRRSLQKPAQEVVDGSVGRWGQDILNVGYNCSGTERALVGYLSAVYLAGNKNGRKYVK